jgi:lysophospholipid acyltransferase (LPLAT)-like uncharacterized protein
VTRSRSESSPNVLKNRVLLKLLGERVVTPKRLAIDRAESGISDFAKSTSEEYQASAVRVFTRRSRACRSGASALAEKSLPNALERSGSSERFLAIFGSKILRLLFLTLRLEFEDRAGLFKNVPKSPVIICFWHNRILGITLTFIRHYPGNARKGVTVLTSASRDGEVLAQLVAQFGMGAVRGSSSRRGSRALRELVAQDESGRDIAITPDGPRGPRYSLGSGAISLAQLTATSIVPMHAKFSRCFRMKSWDGFIVPLPFSKVRVTVDDSISVPRELSNEQFEAMRSRVETLLRNEAD